MFALKSRTFEYPDVALSNTDATAEDEIEAMEAELCAILIDLEARAKYGKIQGAAVPLLVRAKTVNDDIRKRLRTADAKARDRFEPNFMHLNGQLRTVALAMAHLCRRDVRPHA